MLVPLHEADPRTIGGKGAALLRLQRHGLPVPRAWVLSTEVYAAFLRHTGLWEAARQPTPDLAARILTAAMPFTLSCPAPQVAVRSSALDEDGREASHAGLYESVLGVGAAGLDDAVRRVWASYHTERAWSYRRGAAVDPGGMAVLVQEMVDARASGVLFTTNPLTGSWREMTVEAVWGLGEPLVSGHMVPDQYLVRRPRRTPRPVQRIIAAVPLSLERETIAPQLTELVLGSHGAEERATEAPYARKLGRDELFSLARIGLRAESFLGGPQDVEWAVDRGGHFWVLQSRPITVTTRPPRGGATLWTRRFIGERWPYGATPLGWSIIEPVLSWFIAYPDTSARYLGGDPPLRLVRGHPYFNVTVFRHLAFKIPGTPPPRFMLEFFPPGEVEQWVRRRAAPPDLRVYRSILATTFRERRWQRFRWNPFTNWRVWESFAATLPERLAALAACPAEQAIHVADPLLRDYIKVHITSLLFANMAYEIVGPLVPEADAGVLLRAPKGTITRQVNAELWDLARAPDLLPAFLSRHGHRSDGSWEVFARRWAEDPDGVRQLARLAGDGPDPRTLDRAEDEATEAAMGRLSRSVAAGVRLTQAYLRLREEQRYQLDRILHVLKTRLLERGRALFDDPTKIRWLTVDELDARLDPLELERTITRRAAEGVDAHPADFLVGDDTLPVPPDNSARLQGLGVSPGVARARVRVLARPEEGTRLLPGEILVARATDPGWTPLFHRAGGMLLELGGLLSHGAVVAREYHVPAVVNLPGVTTRLRDGMEVTLDGRSGAVWIPA